MTIFYSPSAKAFFDPAIAAPPSDAVEVTEDQHAALLAAQATGKLIQPGADGMPEAVDPPVEPPVQQTLFAPRDFIALFTPAEQQALFTARQSQWQIDLFITKALAGNVDVTNQETIDGVNSVQAAGLLTAARAKAILAGQVPSS